MKSTVEVLRDWFLFTAALVVVVSFPRTFFLVAMVPFAVGAARYLYAYGDGPDTLFPQIQRDASILARDLAGEWLGKFGRWLSKSFPGKSSETDAVE